MYCECMKIFKSKKSWSPSTMDRVLGILYLRRHSRETCWRFEIGSGAATLTTNAI